MKNQNSDSQRVINAVFNYVPTRYKADDAEWAIRKFIWSFKDGNEEVCAKAVSVVVEAITANYGDVNNVVFSCIPASSQEKTDKRYKKFTEEVCNATGMVNAYDKIKVEGNRLAIHEFKSKKRVQNTSVIKLTKKFFAGKEVIVFDDIITRGRSFNAFADAIEEMGATVKGGLFLAQTINPTNK